MTRILVVEDDAPLRRSLTLNLRARSYEVDETGNGEDALRIVGRRTPDVVLLDLGLPGMSGMDVIAGLRAWSDVPVIVLSARGDERDKVAALDAGANDYVTKPFGVDELLARLRVAERLAASRRVNGGPLAMQGVTVDLGARSVVDRDGADVHLTPIEWALLQHLVDADGRVVTHAELLEAVWGIAFDGDSSYLRVHVAHLRKKLEADAARPRHLRTEPGIGYRFVT